MGYGCGDGEEGDEFAEESVVRGGDWRGGYGGREW